MKVNKLMIDDWVYNQHHKKNIKITPFDFFTHGHLPSGRQYFIGEPELVSGRDLESIPITPEILAKNCTKVNILENNVHEYTEYIFNDDTMVVSEKDMPFVFGFENADGEHIYKKIEYVHELQHLLKLVGIDKNIEL